MQPPIQITNACVLLIPVGSTSSALANHLSAGHIGQEGGQHGPLACKFRRVWCSCPRHRRFLNKYWKETSHCKMFENNRLFYVPSSVTLWIKFHSSQPSSISSQDYRPCPSLLTSSCPTSKSNYYLEPKSKVTQGACLSSCLSFPLSPCFPTSNPQLPVPPFSSFSSLLWSGNRGNFLPKVCTYRKLREKPSTPSHFIS